MSPKWDHVPPPVRAVEVRELAPVEGLLAWADATAEPQTGKLTEVELTDHITDMWSLPLPPLPTVEQKHPWVWLVYALGVVAAAAASALLPIWQVAP